ncbi:hypothetical protein LEN26_003498 [Aphanomyces euteiches]|nr:hypothetical protein LEN26_020945 [Aphanomyces euteiches]KAH9084292.1 hypothetical protein LEN26_020946 [Aphanomyces euteiches]KAH9153734.1 hypothetical protein LEN26_003498 [Aphanomyces euteiches]KAH9163883.1 hypothetical protein AeNC1_018733 [Aphanomyces euteiches]
MTNEQIATFAAGCFWSIQLHFQRLEGVLDIHVGYINGTVANPTYQQVCTGKTGHAEAVQVKFDANVDSYDQLLDLFWSIHDPTTLNRQKNDVGTQYRSGIYYHNDEQKAQAEASKRHQQAKRSIERWLFCQNVVTEILPAGPFYMAEEYHQKYLEKGGQCANKGSKDKVRCYG